MNEIVILSGQIGTGKTTLAKNLESNFGFFHVKTRDFLTARGRGLQLERSALQLFGEKLDSKTGGAWVVEDLDAFLRNSHRPCPVVLDSVRHLGQIESLRRAYGRKIIHIHLEADFKELEARYRKRLSDGMGIRELPSYSAAHQNKTESRVNRLSKFADVVIRTDRCTPEDVLVRVASHIGCYGRECLRLVDVLVGGQYGSEGKGQIAAYLSREYDFLVRVGGPNAGHKVKVGGSVFTFRHLPSGTLSSDAKIIIGAGAVLHVPTLLEEIAACKVDRDRLSIDPQAMTISQRDRASEGVLKANIGSTGQGVGFATARRVTRRGQSGVKLARDIAELRPFVRETGRIFEKAFSEGNRILLEGTQGTGLSLFHGFYPHVTSRDTTVAGCLAEAGISATRVRKAIMVCRTYPIRVMSPSQDGKTSGYMSKELMWGEIERRAGAVEGEFASLEKGSVSHNLRRVAEFDWVLLRRAASLNAPTDIALTFADYISKKNSTVHRFEQLTESTIRFIEEVEMVASAPVTLISTKFDPQGIIDRRAW
ncbi:MAG TPA: adenylosuccinate synthetase [Verrucomicrobiae bacterium]|nr:adenylosuccinate synthetase [Verrucomicrobiae bacterium]